MFQIPSAFSKHQISKPYPEVNQKKITQTISSKTIRDARNDRNAYGPFTRRIREAPILRRLEKPPQMDSYDGRTDPY